MTTKTYLTSNKQDWQTPKYLLNLIEAEFGDFYDPCPTNPLEDGLNTSWEKITFVNPPYGKFQDDWIKKGILESKQGKKIIFLIPSRTDTIRFHNLIFPNASEIRFIKGRLKFSNSKNPSTFPSMIIIFDSKKKTIKKCFCIAKMCGLEGVKPQV